jgi:hypothetical protein
LRSPNQKVEKKNNGGLLLPNGSQATVGDHELLDYKPVKKVQVATEQITAFTGAIK